MRTHPARTRSTFCFLRKFCSKKYWENVFHDDAGGLAECTVLTGSVNIALTVFQRPLLYSTSCFLKIALLLSCHENLRCFSANSFIATLSTTTCYPFESAIIRIGGSYRLSQTRGRHNKFKLGGLCDINQAEPDISIKKL